MDRLPSARIYVVYNPITLAEVKRGLTLSEAVEYAARNDLDHSRETEYDYHQYRNEGFYRRIHAKMLAARGRVTHDLLGKRCAFKVEYLRSRYFVRAHDLPWNSMLPSAGKAEKGDEILISSSSVREYFPAGYETSGSMGEDGTRFSRISRWRIATHPERAQAVIEFVSDEGFDTQEKRRARDFEITDRNRKRWEAARKLSPLAPPAAPVVHFDSDDEPVAIEPPAAGCHTSAPKSTQVLQPKSRQDVVTSLRRTPTRPARPSAHLSGR